MTPGAAPVVIGVGEEFRHDDGAGPAVVAELRKLAEAGALPPEIRLVTDSGEPTALIELWRDAPLAIVVDAAAADPAAGLAAGDVVRWEAEYRDTGRSPMTPHHSTSTSTSTSTDTDTEQATDDRSAAPPTAGSPLPAITTPAPAPAAAHSPGSAATHALGPGAAIALASVLGRLPARLVLFAVVGADFSLGPGLSPHVADTVYEVVWDIVDEIRRPGLPARTDGDFLSWPGGCTGPRLGS